jgi:hypothetical protein
MQQFTRPCHKSRRVTTYHRRPDALSAFDIYTMMSYQYFQALCAISLTRSHWILMLSMIVDKDDNDLLLDLYCHHQSIYHKNKFFFLLDSMFLAQCSWTLSQKIEFLIFFQPISPTSLTCWTTGGDTTTLVSTFLSFESFTFSQPSSNPQYIYQRTKGFFWRSLHHHSYQTCYW